MWPKHRHTPAASRTADRGARPGPLRTVDRTANPSAASVALVPPGTQMIDGLLGAALRARLVDVVEGPVVAPFAHELHGHSLPAMNPDRYDAVNAISTPITARLSGQITTTAATGAATYIEAQ